MFYPATRWTISLLALTIAGVAAAPAIAADSTIAGTGAVTGTVTAGKPFTAAQVYLRNAEKRVTFMVYTSRRQVPGDQSVSGRLRGERRRAAASPPIRRRSR